MTDFLIRRLGALYAHKVGQWLAAAITLAIVRAAASAAAKYPAVTPLINTPYLVEASIGAVAIAINMLANAVAPRNASEAQVLSDVSADLKTEPLTAKAQPLK